MLTVGLKIRARQPHLLEGPGGHVEVVHVTAAPTFIGVRIIRVIAGAGVRDLWDVANRFGSDLLNGHARREDWRNIHTLSADPWATSAAHVLYSFQLKPLCKCFTILTSAFSRAVCPPHLHDDAGPGVPAHIRSVKRLAVVVGQPRWVASHLEAAPGQSERGRNVGNAIR